MADEPRTQTVAIAPEVVRGLVAAARAAMPREACGLLFGAPAAVTGWSVADNVATTPETHFEIDPTALFAALRRERAGGDRLIGYWHSHPGGEARPSATDAAVAAPDGRLWLVVAGDCVTAWRASARGALHGRFAPLTLVAPPRA